MPADIPAHRRPLLFIYESTGIETHFTNLLDPEPRSRELFHFHRPETLADWLAEEPLWRPESVARTDPRARDPATLRRCDAACGRCQPWRKKDCGASRSEPS